MELNIKDYLITNKRECGCPTCGRVFSGLSAFNVHRVGEAGVDRKCADLERVHRVATTKRWADMTAEEQDFLENEARQWIHILRTDVNIEERVA